MVIIIMIIQTNAYIERERGGGNNDDFNKLLFSSCRRVFAHTFY